MMITLKKKTRFVALGDNIEIALKNLKTNFTKNISSFDENHLKKIFNYERLF